METRRTYDPAEEEITDIVYLLTEQAEKARGMN
jgi:hypothetical protein